MDSIPMVDLRPQHEPLAGALREAAGRVIASGRFILGGEVAAFEREVAARLGVAAAVGVSSGSDALVSMLRASGVQPGDEVMTTPYSFFATAEAILRIGARPVFADVEPATLNLDPARALERMGPATRAVLVVHLFGRVARMEALGAACHERGAVLLEDAAQAIGARAVDGRGVGASGRAAALSFFPAKNLGGLGDGGMVLTNDLGFADAVRRIRNHGADEKHRHDVVGGNFRLDELQAAFLRVKLPHLDAWTDDRRRIAAAYRARLERLPIGLPPPDDGCVWNQFVIRVPAGRREGVIRSLAARRIASAIFYPVPLHLQPALRDLGYRRGDFPVAELAAEETLALPIYPGLGPGAIDRIVDAVAAACR